MQDPNTVLETTMKLNDLPPLPPAIWYSFFIIFLHGSTTIVGQDRFISEVSRSYSGTPHSVGLPWMSDQSDAETST